WIKRQSPPLHANTKEYECAPPLWEPKCRIGCAAGAALRQDGNLCKSCALVEPEHDIHVLHGLAGRTLDQIVDHGQDYQGVPALGPMQSNSADIGCTYRTRIRMTSEGQYIYERLCLVT